MEDGNTRRLPVSILLAEDDDDDYLLTRDALAESRVLNQLSRVRDGEELMGELKRRIACAEPAPALVLLDLNMPRKDGREALREIKEDPALKRIPVVVLTTSRAEEDVLRSYDAGASSFVRKPVTFQGLVEALSVLQRYWFEVVELPERRGPA